ncbi:MAG: hypothetical protein ACRENG_30155, partial [bacterium]
MKRLFQLLLLLAASSLVTPGCSFFTSPDEGRFGDLQINIRFAGATNSGEAAKSEMLVSPQALDRLVVIVFEYSFQDTRGNEFLERELLRREFRLGAERQLQTVIQVPLENPEISCFRVVVRAFEGALQLYSGEDPNVCFDEENRRTQADVLLDPEAFRLQLSNNLPPLSSRFFTLTGQVRDTTVTRIEIVMADSVMMTLPVLGSLFSNPVMLFGDNTLIKVSAYSGLTFRGEASRRVAFTGQKSDILVALVWDQLLDLNLEIQTPLQQIVSAIAPGDSVGGRLVLPDGDGYGPEVYEWRVNSILQRGQFAVRVARQRADLGRPASGRVYILLR